MLYRTTSREIKMGEKGTKKKLIIKIRPEQIKFNVLEIQIHVTKGKKKMIRISGGQKLAGEKRIARYKNGGVIRKMQRWGDFR
jgi:hypothetical protein